MSSIFASMTKPEFTIREPESPLYIKILVAFILTVYVALCYYFLTTKFRGTKTLLYLIILGYFVLKYMVIPYLISAVTYLNFSELKIRTGIEIGRFTIKNKWKQLKDLEYISVFHTDNGYEVNLWYKKNKILKLFALDDYDKVIDEAFFFSEKLSIDLLDARKRGYHKWVDKDIYRKTGEVVHIE